MRVKYLIVPMAVLMAVFFGVGAFDSSVTGVTTATIDTTFVQQNISKEGTDYRYLVITDKETFVCEPNLLQGKFNNSDTFLRLKRGRTYEFSVSGIGKTLVTDYRNILEAREIKK